MPNITGGFYCDSNTFPNVSGAFSYEGKGFVNLKNDTIYNSGIVNFNASKLNPVYGKSSHVTPVNFTYRIWKRIS